MRRLNPASISRDTRPPGQASPRIYDRPPDKELESANAGALDASLAPLTRDGSAQLIFDLSGLRFMDSAGIAVLLGVAAKVAVVRLRDPSPPVRRVIELTGLSAVLPIEL